jgi:hypothetical protein
MAEEQSYFLTDPPRLQGERKALFTLVLTFAVLGVILWGLQIRNTITAPYALSSAAPLTLKQELVDNNIEFLKKIDTTGNGMSDYEKMYVYGTSRYLFDSYGYGLSDKEVLKKGLALCPGAGKNCGGIFSAEGSLTPTGSTTAAFIQGERPAALSNNGTASGASALDSILNDPKKLRQLLVETGRVSAQDLKNVSDADLIKTAQLLFASSTQAAGASASTTVR